MRKYKDFINEKKYTQKEVDRISAARRYSDADVKSAQKHIDFLQKQINQNVQHYRIISGPSEKRKRDDLISIRKRDRERMDNIQKELDAGIQATKDWDDWMKVADPEWMVGDKI